MTVYLYMGVDNSGKLIGGSVKSSSKEKLDSYIQKLELKEVEVFTTATSLFGGFKYTNERDLSIFCKEMNILLKTEHSIEDSLVTISSRLKNKNLQKAVVEIHGLIIEKGISFASALLMYEHVFGKYFISLVEACQETAGFVSVFDDLSVYYEKNYITRNKLSQILVYPMSLILVMSVVIYIFNVNIVPIFTELLEANESSGFLDLILMINNFFENYAMIFLGSFCIIFIIYIVYYNTKKGKQFFDKLLINLPYYSKVRKYSESYKFTHAMSIMIKNGLPLKYSYEQAIDCIENIYLQKALKEAYEDILKGQSLSDSVANVGIYPPEYLHLIDLGEKTECLPEMLDKVTEVLEKDVKDSVDKFISFSEPVVSVVLTSIVIFIFINIMIPIVELINSL